MWIQLYVLALFTADTMNSIFNIWWLYDCHVLRFGNFESLLRANWLFSTDPAMTGLIAAMVQLFFAWRVQVLLKKIWLTGIICILAFCVALGGVGSGVAATNTLVVDFQKYSWIVTPWLICSAVCDVLITLSLIWKLRRETGAWSPTDDILNQIIRHTIQNGLVTSVWSTVDLIVFLADPTALHLAFNYPLAKLYTNTALSSLNARTNLTRNNGWAHTQSSTGGRNKFTPDPLDLRQTQQQNTEVYVNVERHELSDVTETGSTKKPMRWESGEAV